MKKLLSLLSVLTITGTASIPAPLMAMKSSDDEWEIINKDDILTTNRVKRDVGSLTSNSNNDYVPLKQINGIPNSFSNFVVDKNENIIYLLGNFFKLKYGETTPESIKGITDKISNFSVVVDKNNNIYFATTNGAYKLSAGSDTAIKIGGVGGYVSSLAVDSKNNIFVAANAGAYKLSAGSDTAIKISGIGNYVNYIYINKNNNTIYFVVFGGGAYKLSAGSDTPTKINGIPNSFSNFVVDKNDTIYFVVFGGGAYKLSAGSDTAIKIGGINDSVYSLAVDSNDNIYFGTNNSAFKLLAGSDTAIKIGGVGGYVSSLAVDSKNNIFVAANAGAYKLSAGSDTAIKISGISGQINALTIDSKDNIYFGTDNGAYILQTALSWTKQQSQFTMVDSTKTQTWTRNDLIAVDGELNIDIANTNIDKVVFDNVQQPQTSKQWKINVKPETAPRDHNLQVMFTLDGKQYTSEIIVSMQAKIDPPSPPVQQNLSDLIKTTDLGNIVDKNDTTIFTAVNQKNGNVIDDFTQIEISKKDNHSATLSAKSDSKSYKGFVDVTYNVVPATVVDLKIDVKPTSTKATVIKDYLGQIDTSNLTNPVNTFYYANSESVITMVKPTSSSVITGVVYGCDDKWNKTSQSSNIDPTSGIKLDGSQLATKEGKYVIELSDNLGHMNNVYLQIAKDKKIPNYFDTDNGKQFEIWAKANEYDNIRGYGASQLNKLFEESKNWQQLATDSQFAIAVAEWFKTNGRLSSKAPLTKEQVIEQLKTQIPNSIKIPDVNTSNYDINKVSFVLNQTEFNPNDKVNITVKYNSAQSEQFALQIKDSKTPNKKGGLNGLTIVGILLGSLAGLALLGWLFWKFVVDRFILKPIRDKKQKAWRIREDKALAEMQSEEEAEKAKRGK